MKDSEIMPELLAKNKPVNSQKLPRSALAKAKCLPVEHLQQLGLKDVPNGVAIPYDDAAGRLPIQSRPRSSRFEAVRLTEIAAAGRQHGGLRCLASCGRVGQEPADGRLSVRRRGRIR